MEIQYRLIDNEVHIVRCKGNNPIIKIPAMIEGTPVKKIAPYAFSQYKSEEDRDVLRWKCSAESEVSLERESCILCGRSVKEVHLPDGVNAIGNYAFYGCDRLVRLSFSNNLQDFGCGVFIDCKIKEVSIVLYNNRKSGLQDILGELSNKMSVYLTYINEDGKSEEALLHFPEYFEEDRENGPARIFETFYHGTGYSYRNIFFNREVDYLNYDENFQQASVRESAEVVTDILFGRLLYPLQLSLKSRDFYMEFLKNRCEMITEVLVKRDDLKRLKYISSEGLWTEKALRFSIEKASQYGKTEILSYLMNEKHIRFSKKRRTFDL